MKALAVLCLLADVALAQPTPGPPGLTRVNHDATMTGDGKNLTPLGARLATGGGLQGGGAVSLGLIPCPTPGQVLAWSGTAYACTDGATLAIAGTLDTIAMFTPDGSHAGNSLITQSGTTDTVGGILAVNTSGQSKTFSTYYGANSDGLNVWVGGGGLNSLGAIGVTTQGARNAAFGDLALLANTTGFENAGFGYKALTANTTGSDNTAIGSKSLNFNTTGSENTALGTRSLAANTTGNQNSAFGSTNLTANTTGSANVAIGYETLFANTTGSSNVAIGVNGLNSSTTGTVNVAIGYEALFTSVVGNGNVAIGDQALYTSTVDDNVAIGTFAMEASTTGTADVGVGYFALAANTTGSNGTALGYEALDANTTGADNTAVGALAMLHNTTGAINTALGYEALLTNTTGNFNVAIGYQALEVTNASDSVAIGSTALAAATGNFGVAVGYAALLNVTSGTANTAVGYNTGLGITTGGKNTIVGANVTGLSSSLSNNIIIADGDGNKRIQVDSSGNSTLAGSVKINATGATWTSGTGVPVISCAVGDEFSRTDGAVNTTHYNCTATNTWTANGTGVGTITGVTAGLDLTGGGSSGSVTLAVDETLAQHRVGGTCTGPNAITAIAQDGTVTCTTGVATTTDVNTAVSGTSGRSGRFTASHVVGTGAFTDDGTNVSLSGTFRGSGLVTLGGSAGTSAATGVALIVSNAGATCSEVRDTTDSVELEGCTSSSGGFSGTFTNNSYFLQTNATNALKIDTSQQVEVLHAFLVDGNTTLGASNANTLTLTAKIADHVYYGGTAQVIGNYSCAGATMAAGSTDERGTIVTPDTSCVLTFTTAYTTNAPKCTANASSAIAVGVASTTTNVTFTMGSKPTSMTWACDGGL